MDLHISKFITFCLFIQYILKHRQCGCGTEGVLKGLIHQLAVINFETTSFGGGAMFESFLYGFGDPELRMWLLKIYLTVMVKTFDFDVCGLIKTRMKELPTTIQDSCLSTISMIDKFKYRCHQFSLKHPLRFYLDEYWSDNSCKERHLEWAPKIRHLCNFIYTTLIFNFMDVKNFTKEDFKIIHNLLRGLRVYLKSTLDNTDRYDAMLFSEKLLKTVTIPCIN